MIALLLFLLAWLALPPIEGLAAAPTFPRDRSSSRLGAVLLDGISADSPPSSEQNKSRSGAIGPSSILHPGAVAIPEPPRGSTAATISGPARKSIAPTGDPAREPSIPASGGTPADHPAAARRRPTPPAPLARAFATGYS